MRSLGLALSCLLGLAACGGSADPSDTAGCTAAACHALTWCGLTLAAGPDTTVCTAKGLEAGPIDDHYCVDTCISTHAGQSLSCFADRINECDDSPDMPGVIASECSKALDHEPSQACVQDCSEARTACEADCPGTTWEACLDCATSCGTAEAACFAEC